MGPHVVSAATPVGAVRSYLDGKIAHRVDYWDSLVFQRRAGLA